MKIGDLVKSRGWLSAARINGIVVEEAYVGTNVERAQRRGRVLVMWPNAAVQWIPEPYLEKMNEAG